LGFVEDRTPRILEHLGGSALVHDFEAGHDAGFDWEELEEPFTEGMDGLDLETAGRFKRERKKLAGTLSHLGRDSVSFDL